MPPFTRPGPPIVDGAPPKLIEEIQIDVDDAFVGEVVNALAERRAELVELRPSGRDKSRARPDRVQQRAADRDPGHGGNAPDLSWLRAVQGPDRGMAERGASLEC